MYAPPAKVTQKHALLKRLSKIKVYTGTSHWDNHLEALSVQSKFKDIIDLEADCNVWKRIQIGGQLSFIPKAGSDCLPTPLNLCRWQIQTKSKFHLCSWPKATTAHIY